jgi:hypothetical protein
MHHPDATATWKFNTFNFDGERFVCIIPPEIKDLVLLKSPEVLVSRLPLI